MKPFTQLTASGSATAGTFAILFAMMWSGGVVPPIPLQLQDVVFWATFALAFFFSGLMACVIAAEK